MTSEFKDFVLLKPVEVREHTSVQLRCGCEIVVRDMPFFEWKECECREAFAYKDLVNIDDKPFIVLQAEVVVYKPADLSNKEAMDRCPEEGRES